MPVENLEESGLEKNPNLQLAQWRFLLKTDKNKNDEKMKNDLLQAIKEENMSGLYETVNKEFNWPTDAALVAKMNETNEAIVKDLNAKIDDAEKNLGETEIRDFLLKKAEHYSRIGCKDEALSTFRQTAEKTLTMGFKLDMIFHQIRIGLFYMDHDLIKRNLDKAQTLIDEGGDWDRRNRLKVYKGVYSMAVRDFTTAANLFLDTVATFTSYELMDYETFVSYTVVCGVIALERKTIKSKIIKGSEILEVLFDLPELKEFLFTFYDCHYADFFKCLGAKFAKPRTLANIEGKLKYDIYLNLHYKFYVREMRVIAYTQLLQSYQSLSVQYMADQFGVSLTFIDQELSRFIFAGRLHCKIDKVVGVVHTVRPDNINYQYHETIKKGDILLNRVQKLSRVINI